MLLFPRYVVYKLKYSLVIGDFVLLGYFYRSLSPALAVDLDKIVLLEYYFKRSAVIEFAKVNKLKIILLCIFYFQYYEI